MPRERVNYDYIFRKIQGGAYGTNTIHHFIYHSQTYSVVVNRDILPDGCIEYSILQQVSNPSYVAPCIRGEVQNDLLYISNVEKHGRCVLPEISNYQGIILLKYFLKFLKKSHPEIKQSELTDNAKTLCGQRKVNLSDMMMLIKGQPYYAMAGYKPHGHRYEEIYAYNLSILSKLTWRDSVNKIKNLMKDHKIDVSHIEFPNVETDYKKAMKIMFQKYCDDMVKILDYYLDVIGYKSMYGFEYSRQL